MNIIPTTATAVAKFKRQAKAQRKASGSSFAAVLDAVAREHGYSGWKHVTQCHEHTKSIPKPKPVLPPLLATHLEKAAAQYPVAAEVRAAFHSGLVFAMDIKDVDGVDLGSDIVECDEVWPLAAADIWNEFVHDKDGDFDVALVDQLSVDELLEAAYEHLPNFRFLRYTGSETPETLDEAFKRVFSRQFFFIPMYVWLRGRFIDPRD